MKLNEIKRSLVDREAIGQWLMDASESEKPVRFTITSNGEIKIATQIFAVKNKSIESIPYKFYGGGPGFAFWAMKSNLSSIKNIPRTGCAWWLSDTKIRSLVGIEKEIDRAGEGNMTVGAMSISNCPIREGGIGLLLIPGFSRLTYDGVHNEGAFDIINKYLEMRPRGPEHNQKSAEHLLFDCQAELIEAGYEEYAKL